MIVIPNHLSTPEGLHTALAALRDSVDREGAELLAGFGTEISREAATAGLRNLANYLALRHRDLRVLQDALMPWGLSSLGRAEGRVMPTLDAVTAALGALSGSPSAVEHPPLDAFFHGERLLHENTYELFGPVPDDRRVRIMVTMPSEAATDANLVNELVRRGMDVARINCAHDDAAAWESMAHNIARAAELADRPVKIHVDLAGPKPRSVRTQRWKNRPLRVGDRILLADDTSSERKGYAAATACTIDSVLDAITPGDEIWFDDGKMSTVVLDYDGTAFTLEVKTVPDRGFKLKDGRGMNFPVTDLALAALTDDDQPALDFAAVHADLIGYSFVQTPDDIAALQQELARRRADWATVGLIAKIETPRAVSNLPHLIARACAVQPFGVMIARGDLAVEIGFERLAEMQEEIMWICEAAHVPVIWATQVLENFVKTGIPSRGEMTDAAMSARAECVMLNKGPFVHEAVSTLDRLLHTMEMHQHKKTPQLRALSSW
jgi:pyruvate kinase